jgi:tetratricopeptide (TPR) repeat protein
MALEKLGEYDSVILLCNTILSKNPLNPWLLNSKGLAYNELGQHDAAISFYDMTLKIDPKNITALLNKANSLFFLENYVEAIQNYDLAQKIENNNKISLAKSEAFLKLGKEDEAFLAAQGLLISEISSHVEGARIKKMKIFDYYCLVEYDSYKKRKTIKDDEIELNFEF